MDRDITNFRGLGRASRSTEVSYHTESPLKSRTAGDVSAGNGNSPKTAMPKSSENARVQRAGDNDEYSTGYAK